MGIHDLNAWGGLDPHRGGLITKGGWVSNSYCPLHWNRGTQEIPGPSSKAEPQAGGSQQPLWKPGIMLPMCGRYTFTFEAESLAEAFGMVPYGFHIQKGYNIAPGQYIVIVRPEKDRLVPDVAHWGLIPGWVKDPHPPTSRPNLRSQGFAPPESLASPPPRLPYRTVGA